MDEGCETSIPTFGHTPREEARRAIEHPLPRSLGACAVIHGFLSPAECDALVARAEARGFESAERDYPPSYRNNDRQVIDDPELAAWLMRRLAELADGAIEPMLPQDIRDNWRLKGINERLRLCRYRPGQQFRIHQDGVHHRGHGCRSMLTFMVYLTDGDAFEGGDTLFYAAGPSNGQDVVARLRPRIGSLILFDHGIWHAGEALTRGVKHVLRSDLLFERAGASGECPGVTPHHLGYIWTLAALQDGRLASGGRDGRIRLWHGDGSHSATLAGHDQSVLGLCEAQPGVLASVSRDRRLRVWDVESGRCLRTEVAHEAAALSIARVTPQVLATGGADHRVQLWSVAGDRLRTLAGHQGWVWGVASLGDHAVASASEDGSLRLWDLDSGECIAQRTLGNPLRTVHAVPKPGKPGDYDVAVGDESGGVTLWRMEGGAMSLAGAFKAHSAAVRRVRFMRDGSLATCGEDNALRLWHIPSMVLRNEHVLGNFVTDVAELCDGRRVSCGYGGELAFG
ncbi:2OG-Fe(II) oxygenase [Bacillus sp. NP157]|nr:2OG-Fe(II) oxygenase [Bacillus sp. NP157]